MWKNIVIVKRSSREPWSIISITLSKQLVKYVKTKGRTKKTKSTIQRYDIFDFIIHLLTSCIFQQHIITRQDVTCCSNTYDHLSTLYTGVLFSCTYRTLCSENIFLLLFYLIWPCFKYFNQVNIKYYLCHIQIHRWH